MTLSEELFLTVIDNGVLAIIALFLGYRVKLWLQEDQSQRDLVREISSYRADAYQKLWKATEDFRRTNPPVLDRERLEAARDKVDKSYFEEGGAMYLSFEAASRLVAAKTLLADRLSQEAESVTDKELRAAFSRFRTQLKADLLIYTDEEKDEPLHPASE